VNPDQILNLERDGSAQGGSWEAYGHEVHGVLLLVPGFGRKARITVRNDAVEAIAGECPSANHEPLKDDGVDHANVPLEKEKPAQELVRQLTFVLLSTLLTFGLTHEDYRRRECRVKWAHGRAAQDGRQREGDADVPVVTNGARRTGLVTPVTRSVGPYRKGCASAHPLSDLHPFGPAAARGNLAGEWAQDVQNGVRVRVRRDFFGDELPSRELPMQRTCMR